METIILIYLLIGWIIGFAITIYYSFDHIRTNFDEEIIPLTLLCILYWPWFLCLIIHYYLNLIIKKIKDRSN